MFQWTMCAAAAAAALQGSAWGSDVSTFTSAPAFNSAIEGAAAPGGGGIFFEDFSSIDGGPAGTLGFGGFDSLGFVVATLGPLGEIGDLVNPPGAMSTTSAGRPLIFELTQIGGPVYSFGGNFWLRDDLGAALSGSINVQVGRVGGAVDSFALTSTGPSDYFGVVSSTQLTFVIITPTSPMVGVESRGTTPSVTADNITVAGVIPAPGAAGVLALSGLMAMRRRR